MRDDRRSISRPCFPSSNAKNDFFVLKPNPVAQSTVRILSRRVPTATGRVYMKRATREINRCILDSASVA